jgi:cytoskeleton protein RodZ
MPSFGENLRREREMRGVALEEISAATKISVRFLNCLEMEDFDKLPGGIFTRSFIRTYARYLGLDEDRVLAEYQLIAKPKSDVDLSRMTASRPDTRQRASRGPVVAVLLAILLLTGGYAVYRYTRHLSEATASTLKPTPATPTPAATPAGASETTTAAAPAGSESATAPPASAPTASGQASAQGQDFASRGAPSGSTAGAATAEASAAALPEVSGGLVLQVAATERAWVAVDADGKTDLQRVLSPGEIETLKAKDSFDVTTGNAQGIILTLNGETLKPLGRRGEVKSVHLTRNDLKRNSP